MKLMEEFADQVIASGTYEPLDRIYVWNKIRGFVGDEDVEAKDGEPVVKQLVELAVQRGKIDGGQTAREILNDQLYDLMTPAPSVVNHLFWEKYQESPEKATDWFYQLRRTWYLISQRNMVTLKLRSTCLSPKRIRKRLLLRLTIRKRSTLNVRFVWKTKAIRVV